MVITTAQLHLTKPELRLCAGSNPACGVSEIHDVEDLWKWSLLEIRLNAYRRSTIPQKQFTIIIIKWLIIQVFFKLHDRIELLLHYRNISISTFFRDVVLESWDFNTDPTIQEIYKLLIICSTIFLKLDLEISNMIYLLKWTCKIFFFKICFFIGFAKHERSKLAAYIWLCSSCLTVKTFQKSAQFLWAWNKKISESIKSPFFTKKDESLLKLFPQTMMKALGVSW